MTVSIKQPQQPMESVHCSSAAPSSPSSITSVALPASACTLSPRRSSSPEHGDGPGIHSPPTSALRRLYFKSARVSRTAKSATVIATVPVPKVVVIGSSTISETTINTSTDSTSTHITNVTTTTETETNDSLDLGDISGQSDPLLSSLDDESSSIVMHQSDGNCDDDVDANVTIINGSDTPLLTSWDQELKDMSPKSPKFSPKSANISHQHPRAGPVATVTRFPFDPPISPKVSRVPLAKTHETMFSFDESPNPVRRATPKAPAPVTEPAPDNSPNRECGPKVSDQVRDGRPRPQESTPKRLMHTFMSRKDRFMQQTGKSVTSAPAGGGGYSSKNPNYDPDLTMFPFDREAIDYERIQRECFAVEEELLFDRDYGDYCESPSKAMLDSDLFIDHCSLFQAYEYLTQQERDTNERAPSKRNWREAAERRTVPLDAFSPQRQRKPTEPIIRSLRLAKFDQIATKFDLMPAKYERSSVPLPDLRFDYFAETSCSTLPDAAAGDPDHAGESPDIHAKTHASPICPTSSSSTAVAATAVAATAAASASLRTVETIGTGALSTGAINVTPNPMDGAVCTQPRATIVVQQPSLSLDYSSVETILLKNENDFVSVEQVKELNRKKKQQQREENMRQLLDVTNTLTTEEIKDFEMRYGSPHHSRSQSVKTPGSRSSGRPNQLCLPQQRSRVASMPNTGVEEEYYRLRHFSITGKGVVNRGDSLKSRRSKSNNSVASSHSSTEHLTAAGAGSARTSATCSLASSRESSTSNPASGPYKVLMLGGAAVGKSSLVSQFMTSEYLHAYDTSIDDDSGDKMVSVLLSGEESELSFIDHSYTEMSPENCMSTYEPHGYCVIYSSADKGSFLIAERVLQILWTTENIAQKAVILVANKADLARSRMVTPDEGKAMATQYDCKFIETSVGINHNVDELLVGLLSQIRLKLENPEKSRDLFRKRSIRKSKRRACSPLGGAICLSGIGGRTNPSTPVSGQPATDGGFVETPPGSAHSSPRKYRGSRTSASLKVKGLLGRVWARDSKSKSCENLHVL